jgi:hypothetical protein
MLSIFEIELPRGKDPAKFVAFMEDQYMPAVYMGFTRAGQVQELHLLQEVKEGDEGTSRETRHRFLWLVRSTHQLSDRGAQPSDKGVLRKLERFGVTMKKQPWEEVASRVSEFS